MRLAAAPASRRADPLASCSRRCTRTAIELIDDSHRHAGHAGARDGRGTSACASSRGDFAGLRPLQRHQLVYRSLGELMQTDIHALSITALTPEEAG